jgi:hypothetical protein
VQMSAEGFLHFIYGSFGPDLTFAERKAVLADMA